MWAVALCGLGLVESAFGQNARTNPFQRGPLTKDVQNRNAELSILKRALKQADELSIDQLLELGGKGIEPWSVEIGQRSLAELLRRDKGKVASEGVGILKAGNEPERSHVHFFTAYCLAAVQPGNLNEVFEEVAATASWGAFHVILCYGSQQEAPHFKTAFLRVLNAMEAEHPNRILGRQAPPPAELPLFLPGWGMLAAEYVARNPSPDFLVGLKSLRSRLSNNREGGIVILKPSLEGPQLCEFGSDIVFEDPITFVDELIHRIELPPMESLRPDQNK